MLIDTHCHLDWDSYRNDLDEVIDRALAAGVKRILTIGTDVKTSRRAVEIAAAYAPVYAAVGLHPHDAKGAGDREWRTLLELAGAPKVVAYGEIGLDYFKNYSPQGAQREAFAAQVRLARRAGLPLIVHDRDADEETLAILRAEGGPYEGVFHCFAGDEKVAAEVLELGFHLSFTGSITYKNNRKAPAAIQAAPLDRLLIETDAPFLSPLPHRGKRNEPALVTLVAEKMAALRGVTVDEIARITTANAYRLFRFENAGRRAAIAYEHKGALYLNLTSRCTNACVFCVKQPTFQLGPHYLYLPPDEEPTVEEVLAAVGDPTRYPEIVFCGMGEPTLRWTDLLAIAKKLKRAGAKRIRLDTNGQAESIQGRPIAKEMKGVIDAVNVSLNAADAATYQSLCRPTFGDQAFAAVTDFIGQAKRYVPEVTASAVTVSGVDIQAVENYAEQILGVPFRQR